MSLPLHSIRSKDEENGEGDTQEQRSNCHCGADAGRAPCTPQARSRLPAQIGGHQDSKPGGGGEQRDVR